MFWCNSKIKQDSKIYKKSQEIDEFVENVYARDIFNKFNKKNPKLICNQSGDVVDWNSAFGTDFNNVSKGLRHSLVGLIEGGGKYRFR